MIVEPFEEVSGGKVSAFLSLFIVRVGKPHLFVTQVNRASKLGADPRVKYYLAPEIQEKYGVKVRVCELGIPCLFIPYLSHYLWHLRQDPSLTPNADMSAEDLKSMTQHIHGQKRDLPDSLTNSMKIIKTATRSRLRRKLRLWLSTRSVVQTLDSNTT